MSLYRSLTKEPFVVNTCAFDYTVPQGTTDIKFDFVGFIMTYRGLCVAS